ncbi:MAG: hypothetical protein ABI539_05955 [Acidobacteriota bacterium]
MKIKIFAAFASVLLVLDLAGGALAGGKRDRKARAQTQPLVALLPASDVVATLDGRRFFGEALPRILSSNQPILSSIVAKIDEMQTKTGLDVRQFESIAVGVAARKIAAKDYDLDPVVIARGQINSSALIGAVKLASNGKYREEKIGTRTIYVISGKDLATAGGQAVRTTGTADKFMDKLSSDVAVTAFDGNTIIFGTPDRVRLTLGAKSRVGTDISGLLGKRESSVLNFAAKMPDGMSAFVPLDNDELGKNIDSVRYLFGSMDVGVAGAGLNLTARTLQNAQAQGLLETLEGLQMLGKAFLGGSKGPDKQVYARLIENAKFTAKGNEVILDLQVPQGDIDILVGYLK